MTRKLIVVVLGVLLAAGCGSVPTEGPVRSSNQSGAGRNVPVEVHALPPVRGAKPAQIVSGFLDAMGHPRNVDVARQYLTKEAAAAWQPERGTVVYDDPLQTTVVSPDEQGNFVLDAARIAGLDSRGSWRPAKPGSRLTFKFELDEVQGEWRIAKAPPEGMYINSFMLENDFRLVNLYFFNPALDRLIPDPVYLPRLTASLSQSASQVTKALFAGPTNRLGRSVATLVPEDTQVNVSVPVDSSGVATVSLNEPPSRLGADERDRLAAQIVWTLHEISIRAVRLTANNAPLDDGGAAELRREDYDQWAPVPGNANAERLFVLPQRGPGIGQVTGFDATSQPGENKVASQFDKFEGESLAVDLTADRAAMVVDGMVRLGRLDPDDKNGLHDIRTEGAVLRPSFDANGYLWIVDRAGGTSPRIRRIDPQNLKEESIALTAPVAGQRIRVLRVAPDGVRVLLVVGPDGSRRVTVGRLTSTGAQTRSRLEGFEALHLLFSDVVDAGWSRPDRITVLGSSSGTHRANQPLEVNIDGSIQTKIPGREYYNLVDLAVSPASTTLLVVRDENRRLHVRSRDVRWNELMATGQPAYPG